MPDVAYVDGRFVPLQEARVPLSDRAYYFADAVYEVFTTFCGKIFMFDAHLDRLEHSLRGVKIDYKVDRRRIADLLAEGIQRAGYSDSLIYLQVSRGCALRDKQFPTPKNPNLIVTVRKKPAPDPARYEKGIKVLLVADERWVHCHYKTTMLLPNILAYQAAIDRGQDDAIFFDPKSGQVHEATSANVFVVRAGRLITPAKCPKILSGTVRQYVIDLARTNGIEAEERPLTVDELRAADEIFLTGTTTEVLGVVAVDDLPIGEGRPGRITRRLHRLFLESVGCTAAP